VGLHYTSAAPKSSTVTNIEFPHFQCCNRQVQLRDRVNGARNTVWGPMLRRSTYHGRSYPTLGGWGGSPAESKILAGRPEDACEECTDEGPCIRHDKRPGVFTMPSATFLSRVMQGRLMQCDIYLHCTVGQLPQPPADVG